MYKITKKKTFYIVVSLCLSTLALYLGTLEAAKFLHRHLLHNVMRAPTTTFFDITPVGRIINRFSHDIDAVDNELPSTLRAFSSCIFGVFFFFQFVILLLFRKYFKIFKLYFLQLQL